MKKYKFVAQLSFLIFYCILVFIILIIFAGLIFVILTKKGEPLYLGIIIVSVTGIYDLILVLLIFYVFSLVIVYNDDKIMLKRFNHIIRQINVEDIKDIYLVNCKYPFFVIVDDLIIPKKAQSILSSKNFIKFEVRKKSLDFIKNVLNMEYMKIELSDYKDLIKYLQRIRR